MFTRSAISAAVVTGFMLAGGCGSDGDSDRTTRRTEVNTRERATSSRDTSPRVTRTSATTQVQSAIGKPDEFFLVAASHLNAAEVATGRLAVERASDPEVKRFGEHMIGDHTRAAEELQRLAEGKGVSLPSRPDETHRMLANHLEALEGEQFDREYVSAMVADHASALSMMQDRARLTEDPAIRDFADRQTAIMRDHLQMAQELNRKLGAGAGSGNDQPGSGSSSGAGGHSMGGGGH